MKIILSSQNYDKIIKLITKEDREVVESRHSYLYGDKRKIDIEKWDDTSLVVLKDYLEKEAKKGDRSCSLSLGLVKQWIEIKQNPDSKVVSKLESVPSAMKQYLKAAEHRYVFEQSEDGNLIPWFVSNIEYEPASERRGPAHVIINLLALNSVKDESRSRSERSNHSIHLYSDDVRKRTVSQILEGKGFYMETPERMISYSKEVEKFIELCKEDGFQMSVSGKAYLSEGWERQGYRNVERSGQPAKMVIDPPEELGSGESTTECDFWTNRKGDKEEDEEEASWTLPLHPIYYMFDLNEHSNYRVHVNNAVEYQYNTKVGDKLVLPEDVKDFIETLVEYSSNKFSDIIGGKEGGTIILLEGVPGTGKTLSAEVYSEVMKRPLYKVQSSQLGITAENLETELKNVLQRAERWGAILLIDEADVYIRARAADINQNAIVGVFLRLLEYYKGVLFMTTNRGQEVDDAIISRLTARFRYFKPDKEQQTDLWKILSKQNKIEIEDKEIEEITAKLDLSGRDIKNLLKLAYVASLRNENKITSKLVLRVAKFKQGD